jgi:hypothetical protein
MAKKKLTVENISSSKTKKWKVESAEVPSRVSEFKTFSESKITHVPTFMAAEIKMMLAPDTEGNFRPTILKKNFNAKKPTFAQLKKFLATKEVLAIAMKRPSTGKYECVDYATDLHNLAEKKGISCGIVDILYKHGDGHVMNVFETMDKGLVFVDLAMFGNYTVSAFLGKNENKKRDEFFHTAVNPHYYTQSGKRRKNIEKITITW